MLRSTFSVSDHYGYGVAAKADELRPLLKESSVSEIEDAL